MSGLNIKGFGGCLPLGQVDVVFYLPDGEIHLP